MTIPTRIIEEAEYDRLIREQFAAQGDLILIWDLMALTYGQNKVDELTLTYGKVLKLIYLNVVEPLIYLDPERGATLLVNAYADYDYQEVADLHPDHEADIYVIAPVGWRMGDVEHDLDDADFFFKSDTKTFGKVDIENPLPVNERRSH